jgi:hypothetical protein
MTKINLKIIIFKHGKVEKAFISIFAIFLSAIISSVLLALFVLLLKQIQLLALDASSLQAYYAADSAFECAVFYERDASKRAPGLLKFAYEVTPFRTENFDQFTGCAVSGDVIKLPSISGSGISVTKFNYPISVNDDSRFCGIVTIDRNVTNSSSSNMLSITGRSSDCNSLSDRAVERGIDFVY